MTDDCSECSRHFADNGDLSADTERQSAMGERDIPGKTYRTHSFDKHTAGKDCEALSVRFPGSLDSLIHPWRNLTCVEVESHPRL